MLGAWPLMLKTITVPCRMPTQKKPVPPIHLEGSCFLSPTRTSFSANAHNSRKLFFERRHSLMTRMDGTPNWPRIVAVTRMPANEYTSDRRRCRCRFLTILHYANFSRPRKGPIALFTAISIAMRGQIRPRGFQKSRNLILLTGLLLHGARPRLMADDGRVRLEMLGPCGRCLRAAVTRGAKALAVPRQGRRGWTSFSF
jgi:hypothetical protein